MRPCSPRCPARAPSAGCLAPGPWYLELRTKCDVLSIAALPFVFGTEDVALGTQERCRSSLCQKQDIRAIQIPACSSNAKRVQNGTGHSPISSERLVQYCFRTFEYTYEWFCQLSFHQDEKRAMLMKRALPCGVLSGKSATDRS